MGRNKLFFLSLMLPIFFGYNNCGRSSGDLSGASGPSLSSEALTVGFIGKQQFDFFNPTPQCQSERISPQGSLQMNTSDVSARVETNSCGDQGRDDLDFSDVLVQHYNPYLAFYDDKVWVASSLHQDVVSDPNQSLYYLEYCFNTVEQMDFTMQYLSDPNDPSQKDWVALTMYGDRAEMPGVHFHGGQLQENPNGSKRFLADNGLIEVDITREYEPGKKQALYKKRDGTQVSMTCWFHKP